MLADTEAFVEGVVVVGSGRGREGGREGGMRVRYEETGVEVF